MAKKKPQQVPRADPEFAGQSSTDERSRNPSSIRRIPRATVVAVPVHAGLPDGFRARARKEL
jgi:hypothetical protein